MADVATKAISANDIKLASITVKRHGGSKSLSTAFDIDTENTLTNPDGATASYWDAKLDGRMDDPRYYEGDTQA